jgi:site-specific recombinase XerD
VARSDKSRFPTYRETGPALKPLIADYLEEVEIRGKSAMTAKHYGAYLDAFLDWLAFQTHKTAETVIVSDIDAERLREYQLALARRRDRRTGRPIGAATRNVYTTALREFMKYARHRRSIELPDPVEALPRAKERDIEIRRLGGDEYERMRTAIDLRKPGGLRDRAILEALFGSGARLSEVASLTRRGLDLDRREVQIIGKGSRSRLVFLTTEAADWVRRYLDTRRDDHPAVFVSIKGAPRALGARQIERIVGRAALRAGLPFNVSPHWLRHSRLTIVARHSGVEVAQRVAGHASLNTTARYLHVTDTQLRELYDKADRDERSRAPDRGETGRA